MHAFATFRESELTNNQFVELVTSGQPVHLSSCSIRGEVDLSHCYVSDRIICKDCIFDSAVLAIETRFGSTIHFIHCRFQREIDFTGAHVEGGLNLNGCYFAVTEALSETEQWPDEITAPAMPSQRAGFGHMKIVGTLDMDETLVDGTLDLEGTLVEGCLRLRGAQIAGRLMARRCHIHAECDLDALATPTAKGHHLQKPKQTRIGGDCIFSSSKLGGHVTISGASIEGHVRFTSSNIGGWLIMRPVEVCADLEARCPALLPRAGRPLKDGVPFWGGAINLSYAAVEGTVLLSGAELHGSLRLDSAEVKQDVWLYYTDVGSSPFPETRHPCRMLGKGLVSINATGLRVWGSMEANSVQCDGGVCFDGAHVGRNVSICGTLELGAKSGTGLYPTRIGGDESGFSLLAQSLRVGGSFLLNGVHSSGAVVLINSEIGGKFSLTPFFWYSEDDSCTRLYGGLVLEDCKIGSHLNLRLARIYRPTKVPEGFLCPGLRLCRTRISGEVHAPGLLLRGTLEADGVEIADALDLSGAMVTGDVKLNDARLGTNLLFGSEPEEGVPQFGEMGTWIGGRLVAHKVMVNAGFYLLHCTVGDQAATQEEATLAEKGLAARRKRASRLTTVSKADRSAKATLEIIGAQIGGDLTISSHLSYTATAAPPSESSVIAGHLDGRGIHVEGQCRLASIEVCGDVNLPDAQIGSGLEMIGTRVLGDFDLSGAQVKGEIFRSVQKKTDCEIAKEVYPVVKGRVLLSGAQIRVLRLRFMIPAEGTESTITVPTEVDLDHARIGTLLVSGKMLANTPPRFRFSGMEFDEIVVDDLEVDSPNSKFVHLLDQMEHAEFNQGIYLKFEKWLRDRGRDKDADAVYLALRRRELDAERRNVWRVQSLRNPGKWLSETSRWLGRSVLYHTVADGVRVMRLFWLWVLALVCSIFLFSHSNSVQHPSAFAPKSEYLEDLISKHVNPSEWAEGSRVVWTEEMGKPRNWRWTDGFWVALRVHVPLVEIFAGTDWVPSERQIHGTALRYETYASYMRIFSVIALPLMLTAATGVLKKK
ncbi:MAG: pentapeptide repeat-containing protein [Verrucomicrobia bacterium]|nr:pentapeptide repeat-containing protein [Verrucomicrobiota bacterium]